MSKPKKKKTSSQPQADCCPIDEINVADFAPAGKARLKSKADNVSAGGDNVTEALGASPPQVTPAAETEYVSPSQPLGEKPKTRKATTARRTSMRPERTAERNQRSKKGAAR
jgi:hypothetical protein